jgi:hypothetical protein
MMADEDKEGSEAPKEPGKFYIPLDDDELLKIREQVREDLLIRYRAAAEKYVDLTGQARINAQSYSKEHGLVVIRSLFLLNGGAILALLTFIGSMYGKDSLNVLVAISLSTKLLPAFYAFAVGLIATTLTAIIGYFNWNWAVGTYPDPADLHMWLQHKPLEDPASARQKVRWSLWLAVASAALALICFGVGSYLVTTAFSVLGIS